MGRFARVFGVAVSIAAAYVAASFNNIMDFLQLVFAFVNAPLFATFALGMFWPRATGHGAFSGLVSGILAAAVHHGISLPPGPARGRQGRVSGRGQEVPGGAGPTVRDGDRAGGHGLVGAHLGRPVV